MYDADLRHERVNFSIIIYSFVCQFLFTTIDTDIIKSSLLEVFWDKGDLRNFAKVTGKHLRWSLFLNEVAGLQHVSVS